MSSGALEFIPLYSVRFVSHFFTDAKKDPLNFKIISTALEDIGGDVVAEDEESAEEISEDEEDLI